jgi:hypothetical protein
VRGVPSPDEGVVVAPKPENRDRRLRRNSLDIAEDEAVEHDVTEHDDAQAPKGG